MSEFSSEPTSLTSLEPKPVRTDRLGPARDGLPWWVVGLANLAVVVVLSLVSWWLVVDPEWSSFGLYPQPFTATLFWVILYVIFLGFCLEFVGFERLRQPWRGIAVVVASIVLGVATTIVIAYGYGTFDPAFAAQREGGAGYQTASLFVLFGFLFFVMVVVNWDHWPWKQLGLRQPWVGIGDIVLMLLPTSILYAFFVMPTSASWADPGTQIMSISTVIGYFYSIIVSILITGLMLENWPWRLAGRGGRVALAATVGNLVVGTVLYFALKSLAELLAGPEAVAQLGSSVGVLAAQLGVCWAFWMIMWANGFGNHPVKGSLARRGVVRIVVTLALGISTYLLYFLVIAGGLLHEPVLAGALHGNALGFMDWAIMWTLFYVVCCGSFGLPAPRADQTSEVAR